MKQLLLALLAALALPTAISSETIQKISDYELLSKEGEKFIFACPKKIYKDRECWFQLNSDHMNIMDLQKINRKDIVDSFSYFQFAQPRYLGRYVFIYKSNGNLKRIEFKPKYPTFEYDRMYQYLKIREAIGIWLRNEPLTTKN